MFWVQPWVPGSKNPADGPSRCPNFIPQDGDATKNVNFQHTIDTTTSIEEFKLALASDST